MAKKQRPMSANNYLVLNTRLNTILMRAKEDAKAQTGRTFGTHAIRGSSNYERLIRETLDVAIAIIRRNKRLSSEEKDAVERRLIHDYEYGYKMREKERQAQEEETPNTPIMDQTTVAARMADIEERKKENVRRVAEKFGRWRGRW